MSLDIGISEEIFDVDFPSKIKKLDDALFPLQRQIERQYRNLPWPPNLQSVAVFTQLQGGRGDITAAAKTIALMQKICPTLTFDWLLKGAELDLYDPASFLSYCEDPSKVYIRDWQREPLDKAPVDLCITGPVRILSNKAQLEARISRKISAPIFGFMEIAEDVSNPIYSEILKEVIEKLAGKATDKKIYQILHHRIFPLASSYYGLPMGITSGTGVFLDSARKEAPLSRRYSCPSYLLKMQDDDLRKDILEAMDVFDGQTEPDYDRYSLNFGYAHRPTSLKNYIDCVAVHEKNKHVVIVLNQWSVYARYSTKEFQEDIFTPERLAFLNKKGYRSVVIKGKDTPIILELDEKPAQKRHLTVIIRPKFTQHDVKCMQLASERILATGDNSAVEAWCSKCKLYLYEDVNTGCKWRFLQQQVDFAKTISPKLSRLLALFGGDLRLPVDTLNMLPKEQMIEIEELLHDPGLEEATLQFCDLLTGPDYSFEEVLKGALKRTAWHHCIPELAELEADALDLDFREGLIAYLKDPQTARKIFQIKNLPELGGRVQDAVYRSMEPSSNHSWMSCSIS